MSDAIVVLNAGSSSIKFSLFVERGETLEPDVRGQIEGLYTEPRFVAKAPDGTVKAEKSWPAGVELGHDGALDHLVDHLRSELAGDRLIGIVAGWLTIPASNDRSWQRMSLLYRMPQDRETSSPSIISAICSTGRKTTTRCSTTTRPSISTVWTPWILSPSTGWGIPNSGAADS